MKKQHNSNQPHIPAQQITLTGVFTAFVSVICALPVGIELFGVPATLQTFAMALIGFLLGSRQSVIICSIYLLLGLAGIPVFNKFQAGPSVLFGLPGGFLFGFLFLCLFCGLSATYGTRLTHRYARWLFAIFTSILGLALCHLCGILQFATLSEHSLWQSFLLVSLPYLPKDILSLWLAYGAASRIRRIGQKSLRF